MATTLYCGPGTGGRLHRAVALRQAKPVEYMWC